MAAKAGARFAGIAPAAVLLAGMAMGGCSLAPAYRPAQVAVPAHFAETPSGWGEATPMDAVSRGPWWHGFDDPVLDDLERRAAAASPTLAAALARYEEARAVVGQAKAAQLPEIDAEASAAREHLAQDKPLLSRSANLTYDDYLAGGQLSWELDLWGRVRNSVKAARAEQQASAGDLAAARLSLEADVADAYARLRGLDAEEDLLVRTVAAYTRALDLTVTRHDGGIDSGIDVNRARTNLGNARAQVSAIANRRAACLHELAALVGALASDFHVAPVAHPLSAMASPPGTPSALVQRRPDIAAAERRMAEANAGIGVARAALFPTVMLGASGGYETSGPALLSTPNAFWGIGPASVSLPLFDYGKRAAGVRLARAQYDEVTARYRTTVLAAFRQVEDALAAERHLATEASDQKGAASAARATSDLAFIRYREGAASYFEVVQAQTDALNAEQAWLEVETQRAQASVALVRALGGPVG